MGYGILARRPRAKAGAWLLLPVLAFSAHEVEAQQTTPRAGEAARTFELRPREGLARQFEDGYRRHLDWHIGAGDPWAWYMWQVTDGERAGLYVDGTFGHAWENFDAAVDPPGDAADNARNVDPFSTRPGGHAWRARPSLGGAPVGLETAPFVLRAEYRVRPGAEAAFVAALRRLRGAPGRRAYAVYELASGGGAPTYAVWTPAATWAEAGTVANLPATLAAGDTARQAAYVAMMAATERIRRELWRFRPDLSICRTPAARCHRTLAAASDTVGVLVVTGGPAHYHRTELVPASFYTLLEGRPHLAWDHATDDEAAFASDLRERYDVVLFYNRSDSLSSAARDNLRTFVESGKGVVVLHHALGSYNGWPWWWREVVGGKYQMKEGDVPASTFKQGERIDARVAVQHPSLRP